MKLEVGQPTFGTSAVLLDAPPLAEVAEGSVPLCANPAILVTGMGGLLVSSAGDTL